MISKSCEPDSPRMALFLVPSLDVYLETIHGTDTLHGSHTCAGASPSCYRTLSCALWTESSLLELSLAGGDLSWSSSLCLSLAVLRHQPALLRLDISRCSLPLIGLSVLLKGAAASHSLEDIHFAGTFWAKQACSKVALLLADEIPSTGRACSRSFTIQNARRRRYVMCSLQILGNGLVFVQVYLY
jgi:hypothetical protein